MPNRDSEAGTTQPEARLLKLVAYLLARGGVVPRDDIWEEFSKDYAGSFSAKEKKWTRDKRALEEAGIPVQFVDGEPGAPSGYRVDPREYCLPSIAFTAEEMAVLRAAGSAATRLGGHPWHVDLESALRKLRWYGAEAAAAPARAPRPAVTYPAREVGAHEARFVEVVREAVQRRKRVRLRYFTARRQDEAERDVDVYGYAWRRGVWLFAGYCHLRQALRVFYVSRVKEIALLRPRDPAPAYAIPKDFDIRTFADQQPWEYWVHPPQEVQVLFRAGPGLDITPALVVQQLPGARIDERPEGVLATVTARNGDALVRHVFSLGLDVEILAPAALRRAARALLERIAEGGEP